VANVHEGYIDTSDVLEMPFTDDEFVRYVLKPGDVLLNEGQSLELVGRSAVYRGEPRECCFQNTLVRFRANSDTDPEFAHYLFEYLRKTGVLSNIAVQTTSIAHLGVDRFGSLKVWWPSLSDQQRIVEVMQTWDRKIKLVGDLIKAKLWFRHGVLQQLFTGKRRFVHFNGGELQEVQLKKIFEKVADPIKLGSDESYREIGIRSHGKGIFHKEPVTGRSLGSKRVYPVIPGCLTLNIVFAWERSLAVTTVRESGMIASHRFPMFRPNLERVLPEYALLYLLSKKGTEALQLASPGGAGRNRTLSQLEFLKTPIPLPTVAEQRKIIDYVETSDCEIDLLRRERDALKQQKHGLLHKLLSDPGRVKAAS
jgi:type I restriction enzyme S subunit